MRGHSVTGFVLPLQSRVIATLRSCTDGMRETEWFPYRLNLICNKEKSVVYLIELLRHGKVATRTALPAMIRREMSFRFGMVKLQPAQFQRDRLPSIQVSALAW